MKELKIDKPEEEIKEAFDNADTDGNGSIDFFEFVNFVKVENVMPVLRESVGEVNLDELGINVDTPELEFFMKLVYVLTDYENKNSITFDQFKICMKNILGLFGISDEIPDSDMKEAFDAADTDKSGTLEYDEYCEIIKKFMDSD